MYILCELVGGEGRGGRGEDIIKRISRMWVCNMLLRDTTVQSVWETFAPSYSRWVYIFLPEAFRSNNFFFYIRFLLYYRISLDYGYEDGAYCLSTRSAATYERTLCLPSAPLSIVGWSWKHANSGAAITVVTPPITYYWTVPLILDHSYLVGKLTS
jgi:hypothetical protein